MTLQNQKGSKRAVCFSAGKRKLMSEFEEAKSPVKFSRINENTKGDIILNNQSKITPCDASKIPFKHNPKLSKDSIVTLKDMEHLTPWQLVSTKVCVSERDEVIQHHGVDGVIEKQSLVINDTTGCRTLILYGNDVSTLEVGETYLLKNLRLRIVNGKVLFSIARKTKSFHMRKS